MNLLNITTPSIGFNTVEISHSPSSDCAPVSTIEMHRNNMISSRLLSLRFAFMQAKWQIVGSFHQTL